jgi:hypothetical protein
VPCWNKNQTHPAVTRILLIQTQIPTLTPNLARTPPHRIQNLPLALGGADEPLHPLAEGGISRARLPAAVSKMTLVDPLLRVVVHETTHSPHLHPHAEVPEMTLARLLHAAEDVTPLVGRPRLLPRDTETDGGPLVVIRLLTEEEMTVRLHLARGMWMGAIAVSGMVGMTGGAGMISAIKGGMNDRLEVIGVEGSLMRGTESMVVAGNDLLVTEGVWRFEVCTCTHTILMFRLHEMNPLDIIYLDAVEFITACGQLESGNC